ncbi:MULTISPECIES: hypothetical protein [unclassified Microbacterium]|uniref:hypothetical protein n=1 Tax=unclassified Microbacterium TaxID=2609290 RepID=UPI0011B0B4F2|nr:MULTISPECIES: hypothetical protein [unclassified Microbacterium]
MPSPQSLADFDLFALQDEVAVGALDGRLDVQVLEDHHLRVPLIRAQNQALGTTYRHWIGVDDTTSPVTVVGGGLAQFWSAAVSTSTDPSLRRSAFINLLQPLVVDELARGRQVISPSVWTEDLVAFKEFDGVEVETRHADDHFFMFITAAESKAEFISNLPRNARKVWSRDRRASERLRLSSHVSPLTAAGCFEASSSLADTGTRNGEETLPAIAEWRLASYLRRPGDHMLIRITREHDVVAYVAARLAGTILDVHSFGMSSRLGERREVYQHMFDAVLDIALLRGVTAIHFGVGHAHPKLVRGCVPVARAWVRFYPI